MIYQIQALSIAIIIAYLSPSYTITGRVEQTYAYCGGAKPTQKILDNLAKPQPFANKTFYIRKGQTNDPNCKIIKKFTSDSSGNFSFKLPKGTYSIIVEEQVKAINAKDYTSKSQTVDDKCLQTWWQKPYYLLVIKKNNDPLNFIFQHRCYINSDVPCLTYTGPVHH